MAGTGTHTCVFFDDGWLEPICICGQRALYLVDENGTDGVLVLLDDDIAAVAASGVRGRLPEDLAVSA